MADSMIRKSGLSAVLIVGSMFTAIGIGLVWGAVYVLSHERGPSTGLMVLLAFGWMSLAMVVSIALALPNGQMSGKTSRRVGVVTVQTNAPLNGQLATTITGPGAEVAGEADITVRSRAPAVSLYLSGAGLTATTIYLYVIGRTTLIGLGTGIMMAYCIANWGKQAEPPRLGEARRRPLGFPAQAGARRRGGTG